MGKKWEIGNIENGHGKYTYKNGDVYEGEWKDFQRHGQGKLIQTDGTSWEGPWFKDKKHGRGIATIFGTKDAMTYENDKIIKIWEIGNIENGHGKHIYRNGKVYEGEWKDFQRHGQGKITYPVGVSWEGPWFQDKMHGTGIKTRKDGEKEEVTFEHGEKVYE